MSRRPHEIDALQDRREFVERAVRAPSRRTSRFSVDREIVVEGALVAEPADATSKLTSIDRREVQSEDRTLPRAESDQSGEEAQEARLAGAVRADQAR